MDEIGFKDVKNKIKYLIIFKLMLSVNIVVEQY